MILSDIKGYLIERGHASLTDLTLHFDTHPDALRGMLEQWIRRGKVRKQPTNTSCGSCCTKCDPAVTEIYEWIGPEVVGTSIECIRVEACDK